MCLSLGKGAGVTNCKIHGYENIEFKCKYCCSVALWHCWGTTHFCEPCHNTCSYEHMPCKGPEECPLMGCHPPPGEEFALGCTLCKLELDVLKLQPIDDDYRPEGEFYNHRNYVGLDI